MKGFESLAEICVEKLKEDYNYDIDNIVLDDIEYKVRIEHRSGFKECLMSVIPNFAYQCGYNSVVYTNSLRYKDTFDKNVLIELFKKFKEKIKNSHFVLHCELEKIKSVYIEICDKNEYVAKIEFLKELGQEGTCYICQDSTLNTEHIKGCRHHIHLGCLYKYQMSKNLRAYRCGICRKTTNWGDTFGDSDNEEEQDN